MINLTLCPRELEGDIPEFKVESTVEATKLVTDFLNKENGVFIMFISNEIGDDYKSHHKPLFITHNEEEIKNSLGVFLNFIKSESRLCIFVEKSYRQALSYCVDLKDGME